MVAELYLRLRNWNEVRQNVIEMNLLQSRTLNTSKRLCSEINSRLKTCSEKELNLLIDGTPKEQKYLLWIALCRRYHFIGDFSLEVIREKFLSLKFVLTYEDFDLFFNRKSEWHEELENIQLSTKVKLRQFLFRMLREAGILADNKTIQPTFFSQALLEIMADNHYHDLRFFPILEPHLIRQ